MRIFDLVQFYLLLLLTYLRDMKAYCLTTGHCIVCHCCCILSCYALCFLILLALKSSVFFWLLPLHFCRLKKIIFLFCLCFFSALCRFFSTFFSLFFSLCFCFFFAFFSLFFCFFVAFFSLIFSLFVRIFFAFFFFRFYFAFFFLLFFSLFFRFFPRENAIFDFQQKPEKLPKNEVQKKRTKSDKKNDKKRKQKKTQKKSGNKNADIHPISTAFSSEGSCLPSCGFVFCILRFLCCMFLLGFCFDVPSLTYILPCHISKINKPIHPDFGKHARCDSYAYRSTHLRYIQASDILKRSNRR